MDNLYTSDNEGPDGMSSSHVGFKLEQLNSSRLKKSELVKKTLSIVFGAAEPYGREDGEREEVRFKDAAGSRLFCKEIFFAK